MNKEGEELSNFNGSSWQTEEKRAFGCKFLPPIPLPQEAFKNKVVIRNNKRERG